MECVCGCGRKLSGKLTDRNVAAATVALELLVWDRDRAGPGPEPPGREALIARGAECYARLLAALHGETTADPDADCEAWLREAAAMRADRSDLTKTPLIGGRPPRLSKRDLEQLDRRRPERSFTGSEDEAAGPTDPPPAPATADELIGRLERLRALRADGTLTEAEFAAAKARLLADG